MSEILERKDISIEEKLSLYNQALQKFMYKNTSKNIEIIHKDLFHLYLKLTINLSPSPFHLYFLLLIFLLDVFLLSLLNDDPLIIILFLVLH